MGTVKAYFIPVERGRPWWCKREKEKLETVQKWSLRA